MPFRDTTNPERAKTAETALAVTYGEHPGEDEVTDMLTDLRHYCEENGINMDECLLIANAHFDEEQRIPEE